LAQKGQQKPVKTNTKCIAGASPISVCLSRPQKNKVKSALKPEIKSPVPDTLNWLKKATQKLAQKAHPKLVKNQHKLHCWCQFHFQVSDSARNKNKVKSASSPEYRGQCRTLQTGSKGPSKVSQKPVQTLLPVPVSFPSVQFGYKKK
jgi:hypothetical protein